MYARYGTFQCTSAEKEVMLATVTSVGISGGEEPIAKQKIEEMVGALQQRWLMSLLYVPVILTVAVEVFSSTTLSDTSAVPTQTYVVFPTFLLSLTVKTLMLSWSTLLFLITVLVPLLAIGTKPSAFFFFQCSTAFNFTPTGNLPSHFRDIVLYGGTFGATIEEGRIVT